MVSSSTANALMVNNANLADKIPGLSATIAADAASLACSSISRASPHPVLASQAEDTIKKNTTIPPFVWKHGDCLGCGDDNHRYLERNSSVIICPNKNRPGVAAAAASNLAKLRANQKKARDGSRTEPKAYKGKA